MEPCIRRAVHGDVPVLVRLNGVVHELHVQAFPSYFKPTDGDELAARYQSLLSQPTTSIWLAEVDGRPVGYVLAQFHDLPEHALCRARRWCEIDEIAVERAWQNKGIGASLVQAVIAEARAQGASDVELTTWCFNGEAQQAFAHMGFTRKSVRYWMNLQSDAEDAFDRAIAESGGSLASLAQEALAEHRAEKDEELDPDRL